MCRPGLSERVHPFGWEEPRVPVGAHDDVPAVVVDDAMMPSAQEDQVASNLQSHPLAIVHPATLALSAGWSYESSAR